MSKINIDAQSILLLKTSEECYNVLNIFIDELAKALRSCQQTVEIFDVKKDNQMSENFFNRPFKAIIGIQTNLINSFTGKKFLILLDHPINMYINNNLECSARNCYILTHDRNYLAFIERYYKDLAGAFYFPPAGILPSPDCIEPTCRFLHKIYEITFFGTYNNYRDFLATLYSYPRSYRIFASRLIHFMLLNPDIPAEKALQKVLGDYDLTLSGRDFLNMFAAMYPIFDCVRFYYREKIIYSLLNAGIEIHVYGDSWKSSPFAEHAKLIHHPSMNMENTLRITQQSKLSLNIMSWHKDGLTERILNAMLCQTVVLSDKSTRLEEEFVDGEDIILFDLAHLDNLPAKVMQLLSDNNYLQRIAQNGYRKATEKHLWIHRAQQLLDYI